MTDCKNYKPNTPDYGYKYIRLKALAEYVVDFPNDQYGIDALRDELWLEEDQPGEDD